MSNHVRSRRKSFFRRWSFRVGFVAATAAAVGGVALLPKVSRGNDYTVTHVGDSGAGSLRQAILDANTAGAGNHTISFDGGLPANSLVQLAGELEHIQVNIVIDGGGHTLSGHNNHEIFFVALGNVTIKNFTLQDGYSQGGNGGATDMGGGGGGGLGAGGAIFVNSGTNVTVENVVFTSNNATGGSGGHALGANVRTGGGGGGGFHGDGGNGGGDAGGGFFPNNGDGGGGGGGGLLGDGGQGDSGNAGAGGGGILFSGGDASSPLPGAGAFLVGGNGGFDGNDGGDATLSGGGGGGAGNGAAGGDGESFGGGGGGGGGGLGGVNGTGATVGGGTGGFGGGGGGGGYYGDGGAAGFGGGDGGSLFTGGNGGLGAGGAIFVRSGGSLTVVNSTFTNNTVAIGQAGWGAAYTGQNGGAEGSAVYVMSGTTLNFSVTNNGSVTVADTIGGDGEVRKIGTGTLVLSGTNTYIGDTHVDNGRLAVNGTVEGAVRVASSGTLGGNGTINSEVFNDGIIAPGNSIGHLNINSNLHLNPSSQLEIEIDATGQSDLITANGNVDLDGSVFVKAAPGNYVNGQHNTFLTYTGNRTGSFSNIYDDLAFFDAFLLYGAQDVSFVLQSNSNNFIDIAQTFNEKSVATVLDDFTGSAIQPIADQMQYMTNSEVQHSLNELSGEVYATSVQTQFQTTTNQLQMLANHLRPTMGSGSFEDVTSARNLPANEMLVSFDRGGELVIRGQSECTPRYTTWGTGYGLGGKASTDGNAAGLGYALGGVQLGIDRWLNDETLAGLYGGYNYAQLDGNGLAQRVQTNSGQVGGYYRRDDGCDYYLLTSGVGIDNYDSSRTINIGGFNANAAANYEGWQSATYLERGRSYSYCGNVLQPYAALQYIYLRQNGFSETGAAPVNLDVAGVDASSLRSVIGGRASREVCTGRGLLLVPQVRAGWLHEFLETDTVINNRFGSVGGSSFAIQGLDLGRDWALVGAGVGWKMTEQLTLTGNYDAQVNANQTFHVGSANVQYVW